MMASQVQKIYSETLVVPVFVISSWITQKDKFNNHSLFCAFFKKDIEYQKYEELSQKYSASFVQPQADENGVVKINFKIPYINTFLMFNDRDNINLTDIKAKPAVVLLRFRVTKTPIGVFSKFIAEAIRIIDDVPVAKYVTVNKKQSKLFDFVIETNTQIDNGAEEDKAPWDF